MSRVRRGSGGFFPPGKCLCATRVLLLAADDCERPKDQLPQFTALIVCMPSARACVCTQWLSDVIGAQLLQ